MNARAELLARCLRLEQERGERALDPAALALAHDELGLSFRVLGELYGLSAGMARYQYLKYRSRDDGRRDAANAGAHRVTTGRPAAVASAENQG